MNGQEHYTNSSYSVAALQKQVCLDILVEEQVLYRMRWKIS